MTTYDSDRRVERLADNLFGVTGDEGVLDTHHVWYDARSGWWFTGPWTADVVPPGHLRPNQDGPFATADEAIADLIGPPR